MAYVFKTLREKTTDILGTIHDFAVNNGWDSLVNDSNLKVIKSTTSTGVDLILGFRNTEDGTDWQIEISVFNSYDASVSFDDQDGRPKDQDGNNFPYWKQWYNFSRELNPSMSPRLLVMNVGQDFLNVYLFGFRDYYTKNINYKYHTSIFAGVTRNFDAVSGGQYLLGQQDDTKAFFYFNDDKWYSYKKVAGGEYQFRVELDIDRQTHSWVDEHGGVYLTPMKFFVAESGDEFKLVGESTSHYLFPDGHPIAPEAIRFEEFDKEFLAYPFLPKSGEFEGTIMTEEEDLF